MTTPLSKAQLDAIATRAAHLYEYVPQTDDADQLAGKDVPALLTEIERLTARLNQAEDDLTGANLGRWEEEQDNLALLTERHSTNEALDDAVAAIRAKDQRLTELEAREKKVAEFVAKRAEFITAIHNCHPDNGHDYDRWQGHAAARRQLALSLGLPVAWPDEAVSK